MDAQRKLWWAFAVLSAKNWCWLPSIRCPSRFRIQWFSVFNFWSPTAQLKYISQSLGPCSCQREEPDRPVIQRPHPEECHPFEKPFVWFAKICRVSGTVGQWVSGLLPPRPLLDVSASLVWIPENAWTVFFDPSIFLFGVSSPWQIFLCQNPMPGKSQVCCCSRKETRSWFWSGPNCGNFRSGAEPFGVASLAVGCLLLLSMTHMFLADHSQTPYVLCLILGHFWKHVEVRYFLQTMQGWSVERERRRRSQFTGKRLPGGLCCKWQPSPGLMEFHGKKPCK